MTYDRPNSLPMVELLESIHAMDEAMDMLRSFHIKMGNIRQ